MSEAKGRIRPVSLGLELTIWVSLQSVEKSTKVRLVGTSDVDDLCREIIRAFPDELGGRGVIELVVRVPKESLPACTDPRAVDFTKFDKVLTNSEATLAEVLKQDTKGKYRGAPTKEAPAGICLFASSFDAIF